MLNQHYTILFEDTFPSHTRIAYYNALAAAGGFEISWVAYDPTVSRMEVMNDKLSDGILITGREDIRELLNAKLTVFPSTVDEQKLVALFGDDFTEKNPAAENPAAESTGAETTAAESTGAEKSAAEIAGAAPIRLIAGFDWQAKLVTEFLAKALPVKHSSRGFEILPSAGFNEQLDALKDQRADVVIVSLADHIFHNPGYLLSARYMILPVFECTPGVLQGYTAVAVKGNQSKLVTALVDAANKLAGSAFENAATIGTHLHSPANLAGISEGLNQAIQLSVSQDNTEHGAFHKQLPLVSFIFLNGIDKNGEQSELWQMPEPVGWERKNLVASTTFMKDFFEYKFFQPGGIGSKRVSFIASHKAIHDQAVVEAIRKQQVWAAGTRTWYELAKNNVWVNGSADGLGMESLSSTWQLPGINIHKNEVEILTNTESAQTWEPEGWTSFGTYQLLPSFSAELKSALSKADIVFWTSFQQFKAAEHLIRPGILHGTPAGKTAQMLAGKSPFVFPSIRAFNWWIQRRK